MGYHGGRLITNGQWSVIFWGTYWTAGKGLEEAKYLAGFTKHMASNTAFTSAMFEYSVAGQSIQPGTFVGAVTVAEDPDVSVGDNDIDDFIEKQIDSGKVPAPGRQMVYSVFLPPGVESTQWAGLAGKSCKDYCGYHTAQFTSRGSDGVLRYIVMPHHDATCPGCVYASMTDGSQQDREWRSSTITMGHEMAETITDPDGMVVSFGWDDLSLGGQGENGDICEGTEDRIDGWSVQKLWSNRANKCVTTAPPASSGGGSSGCPSGFHSRSGYCVPDTLPGFGCTTSGGSPWLIVALFAGSLALRRRRS
jgi:uncharacterized protein (TIGR03382 family)